MRKQLATAISLFGLIAFSGIAHASDPPSDLFFRAELSGDQEVEPVVTDARGDAKFDVNGAETEIEFEFEVKNGVGILGAAGGHIHCAPAGSNGPIAAFLAGEAAPGGFEGKVEMKGTFTDAHIRSTDCGDTITELVDAMLAGDTYVNVHSVANPGGEVRGQIEPDD